MTLILRWYSFFYHFPLILILLALGLIAYLSDSHTLRLPMLPWTGQELSNWLLWGGFADFISLILAVTGRFRYLFPLWTLVVAVLMVQGFLLKPYTFTSAAEFGWVLALIAGALGAFLASLTLLKKKRSIVKR